jgi:hypothetical protein
MKTWRTWYEGYSGDGHMSILSNDTLCLVSICRTTQRLCWQKRLHRQNGTCCWLEVVQTLLWISFQEVIPMEIAHVSATVPAWQRQNYFDWRGSSGAFAKRNLLLLLVGGCPDTPVDLVAGGNTDEKRPCLGNGTNGQTVLTRTPTQAEFVECWNEVIIRNGLPPRISSRWWCHSTHSWYTSWFMCVIRRLLGTLFIRRLLQRQPSYQSIIDNNLDLSIIDNK